MSKSQRDKGARRERQFVELHRELGIHSERVPLSGASRYQENGADVDCYVFGRDDAPLIYEIKARGDGEGFKMLERWLADADALALMRDRAEPMVLLPWKTYLRFLDRIRR